MLFLLACAADPSSLDSESAPARPETTLWINEVQPDRDTGGDWVEFFNVGTDDVTLDGYGLVDETGHTTDLPSSLVVPAGGFVVLACVQAAIATDGTVDVRLDKDGDELSLISDAAMDATVLDKVHWGPLSGDTSWARQPDGGVEWVADPTPTPDAPNE